MGFNVQDFLYFDIETVGKHKNLDILKEKEPKLYELLVKKFTNKSDKDKWGGEDMSMSDLYRRMSSIIPEYGKIVCISFGFVDSNGNWKTQSLTGDEDVIVKNAQDIFEKALERNKIPCGYNIISFDLPYINKKMIKYGVRIPYNILLYDKKPWTLNVFDLCEVWKSTGRYWSSLDEVTYELGLPSPKNALSGDKVHDTYWNDNDIDKIQKYCEGDILALKNIVEKLVISFF